jgi:hypothetical protein
MWLYGSYLSKEPIAPGAKGVIELKYDTSRGGQPFTKHVNIKRCCSY